MREKPFLVFVVPCYNEEETLPRTLTALSDLLAELKAKDLVQEQSLALYVNDGSHDKTWDILTERNKSDPFCRGISFAHNAGHQNAVWAGMEKAREMDADCIISLDADLQDDISIIPEMIENYENGSDIVYGVRNDRSADTAFKRKTAEGFYSFMQWLGVHLVPNHADYRLVARNVLDVLPQIKEEDLFLRGLFPALGFNYSKVYYKRKKREAGISKYPLFKMLAFATKGITNCSVAPLRLAGIFSLFCMIVTLVAIIYSLFSYFSGIVVAGWTSTMICVLFIGSVQLFCISIIGEYISKIYLEVRHRPRFIINKEI